MEDFSEALARCLDEVPAGRVVTCGSIATALGDLRAARSVATWILEHPKTPGAHRVVRADGRPVLSTGLRRLRDEGLRSNGGRVPQNRIVERLTSVGLLDRLRDEQRELASLVIERDGEPPIRRITGVDVAYVGDTLYAAAVSVDANDGRVLEVRRTQGVVSFPYIPTYLAYRELPGVRAVVEQLSIRPDALMIDGHGRLHPAGFGVACHVGVRLDVPTIGVAKHRLTGRPIPGRALEPGTIPLEIHGKICGYAWTPPGRGRPIFVSVGNRISVEESLQIVRRLTRRGYPEPLKLADRVSKEMKRNEKREKGGENGTAKSAVHE